MFDHAQGRVDVSQLSQSNFIIIIIIFSSSEGFSVIFSLGDRTYIYIYINVFFRRRSQSVSIRGEGRVLLWYMASNNTLLIRNYSTSPLLYFSSALARVIKPSPRSFIYIFVAQKLFFPFLYIHMCVRMFAWAQSEYEQWKVSYPNPYNINVRGRIRNANLTIRNYITSKLSIQNLIIWFYFVNPVFY